jgi:hypothetical protein
VVGLLPENTPLPASDKMTYLLARLELGGAAGGRSMPASLARVGAGELTMSEAIGPAVGCLMATFGTNMISSCIFEVSRGRAWSVGLCMYRYDDCVLMIREDRNVEGFVGSGF